MMSPAHRPPAPADRADLTELLAGFAENLTASASSGGQGGIYFREGEINQMLQALASPLKGRVAIIGPARAGKTAVVHGVTTRIGSGQCPPELRGKVVWALTPTGLPQVVIKAGCWMRAAWRLALNTPLVIRGADRRFRNSGSRPAPAC